MINEIITVMLITEKMIIITEMIRTGIIITQI